MEDGRCRAHLCLRDFSGDDFPFRPGTRTTLSWQNCVGKVEQGFRKTVFA